MTTETTEQRWHVEPEEASQGNGFAICSADGVIATITPPEGQALDATDEANARMMAAAPALLAALQRITAEYVIYDIEQGEEDRTHEPFLQAMAAIEQATRRRP